MFALLNVIYVHDVRVDFIDLWHKRLDHVTGKVLRILHKNQYFGNGKVTNMPLCASCILAKQTRVKFPTSLS